MNWYYVDGGRQIGPVTETEFNALVAAGTIKRDTLVWREGMPAWQPYAATRPSDGGVPSGLQPCSQCSGTFAAEEMIRYGDLFVCAACKPGFAQRLKEGAPVLGRFVYGGFWIRFLAKFIDGMILGVINMFFLIPLMFKMAPGMQARPGSSPDISTMLAFQGLTFIIQTFVGGSYEVLFIGRYGATPGKMALRLRVVRPDGSRLNYPRALLRFLGTWVSGLTLGIGYLIAAFDEQKRTLHDRICDTRVVRG